MFKTKAYKKLPYAKQLKYADQWSKSQTKTRKAFNKVLALRKKMPKGKGTYGTKRGRPPKKKNARKNPVKKAKKRKSAPKDMWAI